MIHIKIFSSTYLALLSFLDFFISLFPVLYFFFKKWCVTLIFRNKKWCLVS